MHVVRVVHAILVAFQIGETAVLASQVFFGEAGVVFDIQPDRASIRYEVELIEQNTFVKGWQTPLERKLH